MTALQHSISHDALGTHIDWEHENITPRMIDWFWSNMEKVLESIFPLRALQNLAPEIAECIRYEHVMVVAGLGRGEECLAKPDPMGYRICGSRCRGRWTRGTLSIHRRQCSGHDEMITGGVQCLAAVGGNQA